jgi:predicted protein tyrosine phosphatase
MYPVLKICDQPTFETAVLNGFQFAISIQGKGSRPAVLRPDFQGRRLDLYFDDVIDDPGAARPPDIDALFDFAQSWLPVARSDPASASIIIHCQAGVSRSAATSLLPLAFYFGNYHAAITHLFRTHPHVIPNVLICQLISERLGPSYGADILQSLAKGKEAAAQNA